MMKYIISLSFLFFCYIAEGQVNNSQSGTQFIAQFTYLESLSEQQIDQVEQNLEQNPNVKMIRVDRITSGIFIVTNELTQFDQATIESWLGVSFPVIDCYREGVYRVDNVIPFDDQFCNSSE